MQCITPLWEHQKYAVEKIRESLGIRGYYWLLASPATGKTLTIYKLIEELVVRRTLVITTKAAARGAWVADARDHTEGVTICLASEGPIVDRRLKIEQDVNKTGAIVVVMNYEVVMKLRDVIRWAAFDLVVLDESHKIKTHNSKISLGLAEVCSNIRYKVCMTGTPFDDAPTDSFGQVRFLSPILMSGRAHHQSRVFGKWNDFYEKYAIYRQLSPGVNITLGYKNIDDLNAKIAPFTLRINSADVLTLPDALHIMRDVVMTDEIRRLYGKMKTEFIAQYDGREVTIDNVLTLGMRLHQLTGGYFQPDEGEGMYTHSQAKVDETLSLLDEIGKHPVVIFTRFESEVKMLKQKIEETGKTVKLLTGSAAEHVEWQGTKFIPGEGDVIIVNMAAGSEGINLTRARYVIYFSTGFSATQYEQSLWRCRRPGSDLNHPITYYHLLTERSIDKTIFNAIAYKRDVAAEVYQSLESVV